MLQMVLLRRPRERHENAAAHEYLPRPLSVTLHPSGVPTGPQREGESMAVAHPSRPRRRAHAHNPGHARPGPPGAQGTLGRGDSSESPAWHRPDPWGREARVIHPRGATSESRAAKYVDFSMRMERERGGGGPWPLLDRRSAVPTRMGGTVRSTRILVRRCRCGSLNGSRRGSSPASHESPSVPSPTTADRRRKEHAAERGPSAMPAVSASQLSDCTVPVSDDGCRLKMSGVIAACTPPSTPPLKSITTTPGRADRHDEREAEQQAHSSTTGGQQATRGQANAVVHRGQ